MKKIVLLLTLCLLVVFTLSAKQRTTNEVLDLAKQKLSTLPHTRNVQLQQLSITPASQLLSPAVTRSVMGEAFYLISAANGFVLISGDDRMRPVIGYSDAQHINPNNLPANMLSWFEVYAAEYAYLQSRPTEGAPFSNSSVRSSSGYPLKVDHLTQTVWGQDAPFFNMTPIRDGRHSKTGCVATAMSQIMAYHKHPACGQGVHTYKDKGMDISLDFSKTPFEWNKLKTNYAGSSDVGANNAVAHLMYSSAVSISTVFGATMSESSTVNARAALIDYFDYDKNTVKFYRKNHFTYRTWVDMMKKELSEKRPILYGGLSTKYNGHSFIIDGYDKDELFHVNWGWDYGGGHFSITTLNPFGGDNNIGGFTIGQDMLIGIQKTVGTSSYQSSFVFFSDLKLSAYQIGRNAAFNIEKNHYTNHGELFSGVLQPILYRKTGEVEALLGTPSAHTNVSRSGGVRDLAFNNLSIPFNVPPGEYELHIGVKGHSETTWNKVRGEIADGSHYKVQVTNTGVTFTEATNFNGLTLRSFEVLRDKIYNNMSLAFKLDIDNVGNEWTGRIGVQIVSPDGTSKILAEDLILFHEGTQSIELYITYIDVPVGNYKFIPSYSKDGITWLPLVGSTEVSVEVHPEPKWNEFDINVEAPPVFKAKLPSNEPFEMTAIIRNTGKGPFDGKVFFRARIKGVIGVVMESTKPIFVDAGESKPVTFAVPHTLAQKEYTFRLFYNYSMWGDRQFGDTDYEFSVVAPSLIDKEFAINLDAPPTFNAKLPSNEPFELSAIIRNTGKGPFDGKVFVRAFAKGVADVVMESSELIFVDANESKRVSFSVPHTLGEKDYTFRLMYNHTTEGDKPFADILYEFSVVAPSLIDKEFAINLDAPPTFNAKLPSNEPFELSAIIRNTGKGTFDGKVFVRAFAKGVADVVMESSELIFVDANESKPVSFSVPHTLAEKDYTFRLMYNHTAEGDKQFADILYEFSVVAPSLIDKEFAINLDAPPTFNAKLPSNEPFELSAIIRNTGKGPFDGKVFVRAFAKGVADVVMESSERIFVDANESKRVSFSVPHTLAVKDYTFRLMYNHTTDDDRQFADILYEFSVVAPSLVDKEFVISPSPINDVLNVRTKAPTYGWSIESVGGEWQAASSSNVVVDQEYTISIKDLQPGIYILYLYRKAEGKDPKKLKFVKSNL